MDFKVLSVEKEKWRTVFKIILDAIIFCAKNNLALWGSNDIIGQSNAGIFLSLLEMISHYNPELAVHISNHKKGIVSYFSPAIQNEFLNCLGNTAKQELISRIKEAKYYSMIFDCIPDTAYKEQLCEIIRCVRIADDQCSVEESFIDFIKMTDKTGSGLSVETEQKL